MPAAVVFTKVASILKAAITALARDTNVNQLLQASGLPIELREAQLQFFQGRIAGGSNVRGEGL
jgi:hypothetical protein